MFIKIDELAFELNDNIDSIKHNIKQKFQEIQALNKTFYQTQAANSQSIEFSAMLLSANYHKIKRLKELVAERKPLKFRCFDSFIDCFILISDLELNAQDFTRGVDSTHALAHSVSVRIAGFLINEQSQHKY